MFFFFHWVCSRKENERLFPQKSSCFFLSHASLPFTYWYFTEYTEHKVLQCRNGVKKSSAYVRFLTQGKMTRNDLSKPNKKRLSQPKGHTSCGWNCLIVISDLQRAIREDEYGNWQFRSCLWCFLNKTLGDTAPLFSLFFSFVLPLQRV